MPDCKWMRDEFCVNGDCPMVADYCPVPDTPGVCRFDTRDRITSHSERKIVEACIAMMQGMVDDVKEYLDFVGVELPEDEGEKFSVHLTYGEIIQRLLLYSTSHSGGTSTGMKCRELGFDYGESVVFTFEEDEADNAGGDE